MTSVLCPPKDCVMGDLSPYPGPLVFLSHWWAPWMQDRPAAFSWLQSPVKSFYSFDFLTAGEGGLLSLCTQPHRSFHDITSGGSRHRGPWGITSNQGSENVQDKVLLLLSGWPWLYDPCGLVATNYAEVSVKASLVPLSLYRRYHSVFFPQNLSLLRPAFCIINWHQNLFIS